MQSTFLGTRDDIWKKRNRLRLLIGAHRGTSGGSIVQNTVPAFINALRHGADVVEVDVIMSTDGDFFAFHNGEEEQVFHLKKDIRTMSTAEILSYPLYNSLAERMDTMRLNRLEDVLEALKGKCLINIDRSWFYWKQTIECLNRHEMFDQLILKAHVDTQLLEALESFGARLMYMPILKNQQDYLAELQTVEQYKIPIVAAEVIMSEAGCVETSRKLIDQLHEKKILAWVNSLTLHDCMTLSYGYDDNKAVIDGPAAAWGWLINHGFDIIQTDWPALLKEYLCTHCND